MIEVTRDDRKTVVRPSEGDMVAATLPELRLKVRGIVAEGVRELVIDLSDVQMVDSSGIGLLIAAHNSLCKTGGQLAITNASAELLELFKTLRMHQRFSINGN